MINQDIEALKTLYLFLPNMYCLLKKNGFILRINCRKITFPITQNWQFTSLLLPSLLLAPTYHSNLCHSFLPLATDTDSSSPVMPTNSYYSPPSILSLLLIAYRTEHSNVLSPATGTDCHYFYRSLSDLFYLVDTALYFTSFVSPLIESTFSAPY